MHSRIAFTSFALMWSSTSTAATNTVLQPFENWDIDYGVTQCTAARSFGDASAPIVLGIVPSLSGDTYKLLVSVPRAGPVFARESPGTVDFGQAPIHTRTLYYGGKGVQFSVHQFGVSATDMQRASSAPTVRLRSADGANYTFALSDARALMAGLGKCTADLQHYWNIDGRNMASRAHTKTGDVRSLFTTSDYPTEALEREWQGNWRANPARYQLLIDESGAIAGCDAVAPSGAPALDETFCDVIKARAKFTPARDNQGMPVRSVITTPFVTWSDQNILNTGCMWVTGTAAGVLTTCAPREPMHMLRPIPASPPPPPPPPKSSH